MIQKMLLLILYAVMRLNFLNQSYETKASDQNLSSLINMYLVEDQSQGKYPVIAYPTPGLTVFNSGSGSVVRGMYEQAGVLYAVVDNKFYSYNSAGTRTERGTLTTSTGLVYFAGLIDEILIVDGTNGYHYTISTTTFQSPLTDGDFPQTATSIANLDEFGIATITSSNQYQISAVGNGASWSAADIATVSGSPDNLVRAFINRRELWFFGENTTEIWFNSGASFPFERIQGIFIEYGLAARASIGKGDGTIFFLGQNTSGGLNIIKMDGYIPQVISNRAIAYQINTYTTTSDAVGFVYQQEGHEFYVLTFPTEAKTWVYDLSTQLWHERQSYVSAAYTRWLPNCYAYAYGKHLVGAYNSGTIYQLSTTTYTENGTAIRRRLVTHPFHTDNEKRYTINKFQLVFESAVAASPEFDLEVSRNGGRTYSTAVTKNLGSTTDYGKRIIYDRLGQCRSCAFRVTTTMNAKCIILGAQADLTMSTS